MVGIDSIGGVALFIFLLTLCNQVQGQIQKIQKGLGKGGGVQAHASYIDTIYFIEYSLNMLQNFTEKGVAMVPSANPYLHP